MNIYCSTFDRNYLARALVLYESLLRYNETALFAFCCIDNASVEQLRALTLPRAIVLPIEMYATEDLLALRANRAYGEFCWTCKPIAQRYLLENYPKSNWVIYVDADMMCFGNPDLGLPSDEFHYSLTPHRFHVDHASYEQSVGVFNGGYVAARNSSNGKAVIDYWATKCLESCSASPTDFVYGDQKYLNYFSDNVAGCHISEAKGINAAPWNIMNYKVSARDDGVLLDDDELILYHFQGFKIYENGSASLYTGNWRIPEPIANNIYAPYVAELLLTYRRLRGVTPGFNGGIYKKVRGRYGVLSVIWSSIRKNPNSIKFPLI